MRNRNNLTAAIIAAVALAVGLVLVGDAVTIQACSDTAKEAALKPHVEAALAAMPAGSKDCCREAVINSVKACYNQAATAGAATVAGTQSSCCAGAAHAKVATASSCVQAALAALPAGTHECCRRAVRAAMTACAPELCSYSSAAATASVSGCQKSAATTASASGCQRSAQATTASASGCQKSAATTASASGCEKSTASASGCEKSTATTASASGCQKSAHASLVYADISEREGKRVTLTGAALCGKCNLHATESCETVFQTADGRCYRLLKNNLTKALSDTKSDNGVKIVTRVRKLDGTKYLEVEAFETL